MDYALKIDQTKSLLFSINSSLAAINDENFDETIKKIQEKIKEVNELKSLLKNYTKSSNLFIENDELSVITKQITDQFDNLIKSKTLESIEVSEQIENTQNKKKLLQYNR